jgi:hypothetical protein
LYSRLRKNHLDYPCVKTSHHHVDKNNVTSPLPLSYPTHANYALPKAALLADIYADTGSR